MAHALLIPQYMFMFLPSTTHEVDRT